MTKAVLHSAIAGILLMGGMVHAKQLSAELIMGNGRSWKGKLVGRDGDWIEFSTGTSAQPIRLGASTIKQLNFNVNVDSEKVMTMMNNRQFERVIISLSKVIDEYSEYSDIPSNLSKYNALLMELYYRTGKYEESLAISRKLAEDGRNRDRQAKARVYQILALIDSGKMDEATVLQAKYGWDKETSSDTAPEELYIKAKLLLLNKEYSKAMELVAKVIVFHSHSPDWIQLAEILSAEIYIELGLYDSADEVCRQIMVLYKNTPEFDQAKLLKVKIEKLRTEKKVAEDSASEEV
ncbi:MAG: hypothetical protein ABFR47_01135 [Verrucomicrobiota bacterium]